MDEMTLHWVEVIHAHLFNLEKMEKERKKKMIELSLQEGYVANHSISGNYGQNQDNSEDVLKQRILGVMKMKEFAEIETGCNISEIFKRLDAEYGRERVMKAITALSEEGAIFSTTDEENWKAVN